MRLYNVTPLRLLIIGLVYLWSGVLFGQTIIGRPMLPLNPPSFFPADAGMKFWWVASDLSSSPVSSWTDRITGSVMLQATGGNQPTWSSVNGVVFDGTDDFLTITNVTSASDWAVLVVLKFNNTTQPKMVLGNYAGAEIYLGIADTSGFLYEGTVGGNIALGLLPTTTFDFFTCPTTNALLASRTFTNGIQGWSSAASWNGGTPWPRLGRGNGNAPFNGNIHEIIVWTNYLFSNAQIARIHEYATNTYGVTP